MKRIDNTYQKIANAMPIDFSELFNESIAVFKTVWLQGVLLQLIGLILSAPLLMLNLSFDFNNIGQSTNSEFASPLPLDIFESDSVLSYSLLFVLIFLLSIATNIVSFGFFRIIKQMECGQGFVFLDFFYFFKAKELKKAILLVLINFGITMVALLLFVLPIFYVMIPLMFLAPVFAYNSELKISEIIKLTFKLGHKKWGLTFVTTLLNILLIYILTIATCGLGALFFGCFVQIPIYIIYKKTIGVDAA